MKPPLVIITGPTASGKSELALRLASEVSGVIINGDSMQLYADLTILTSRPRREALAQAEHRLYGEYALPEMCCVERWRERALREIQACHSQGRVPLIVGGTGFYLRSLIAGLSPIPEIPRAIRAATRAWERTVGLETFYRQLCDRDPLASRLRPRDRQRILRAWEVFEATGVSLFEWWRLSPSLPLKEIAVCWSALWPEKETLYQACNRRFTAMLEEGAIDEVERLTRWTIDRPFIDHPLLKAIGVEPIRRYLEGQISYDRARDDGQRAVRRYAKRQRTWLRRQTMTVSMNDIAYTFTTEPQERIRQTIHRWLERRVHV